MTGPCFVDSNVLVYRHDRAEPERQARAEGVLAALWRTRSGRLSAQVLHEFYVVATRRLPVPLDRAAARREVRLLERWDPVPFSADVRDLAWAVEDRFGLSWWDSLIVASARYAGCPVLLTEDLQDGQDLGGVEVVNPFAREMKELRRRVPGLG